MTRVLYWNIEQFGQNKVNDPNLKRKRGAMSGAMLSADRRGLILRVLTAAQPDIFVVLEVTTGAVARGAELLGNGAAGVMSLLGTIRGTPALGATWMVVPALSCGGAGGRCEGIAVFYNSANLTFIGPKVWTAAGAVDPGPAVATAAYSPLWATALPAGGAVPAAYPTGGVALNRVAAQTHFFVPVAPGTMGPAAPAGFPTAAYRSPLLTQFVETAAPARTLDVLAFHASPFLLDAVPGTAAIAGIQEFAGAAPHVQTVVGDFNVDVWSPFAANAYNPLIAAAPGPGFAQALQNPLVAGRSYVMTHIKPGNEALPWGGGYPGFGYLGSSAAHAGFNAIDNIFTRGPVAAPSNITVLNPVAGSPYTAGPAPTPGPSGTVALAQQNPAALPVPAGVAVGDIGALNRFRSWACYGVVRSTSDHLPLVIDV